jgi:hypothetical protein
MIDSRECVQCGASYVPRREHARFCSARCRVAWNAEHQADPAAEVNALAWSIAAMLEAAERIPKVRAADRPRAFAVVSEAVWWTTIVDGTLVRYHPETYDHVLSGQPTAEQPLIEQTLAGLRFVRNQIGQDVDHIDFVRPEANCPHPGGDRVADWTWSPLPEPPCTSLSPGGKAWELARYQAYQAGLAGHTVGETFGRAVAFLELAARQATSAPTAGPGAETGPFVTEVNGSAAVTPK